MQSTALTQVIAKKVFMKNAKMPEHVQKAADISTDNDSVNFSITATRINSSTQNLTEFEKDRAVNLERVKSQVSQKTYSMDKQVINDLAEKIADMFF